jgi:TRAP-type C4-dicarboxylate transport system substrate-binding protein
MCDKKARLCGSIVLMLGLFLICFTGSVYAAVDKVHIRAATNVSATDLMATTMDHFLKVLKEKGKGKVTYEMHTGGVLGSTRDVGKAIQMFSGTVGDLVGYDAVCDISSFPYLYNDVDQANRIWERIGPEFYEGVAKRARWRVLYTWVGAPRDLTVKKLITEPSQVAGLKIRIPSSQIFTTLWKKYFKATPVTITFGELFTALKTGVVDAQENPIYRTVSAGFYDVVPYNIRTRHCYDHVTEEFWQSLSPELQGVFKEAATETRQWTIDENTKTTYQSIGEAVVKYRANMIEPNIEAFRKATAGIEDDFPQLKDIVNKIRSSK